MNQTVITKQPKPDISSVEEKILLEKQLPFNPNAKKGPTIGLYFHELTTQRNFGQKILRFIGSLILGLIFLITFPVIALIIKMVSQEAVFRKVKVPGRRGIVFQQYRYPTTHSHTQKSFGFGNWLKKNGLEKLPSFINVWKGEMEFVGPRPYPVESCNEWNKQLSDFYKRFALKPGFVSVAEPILDQNQNDIKNIAYSLKQELKYVLKPSFKRDFNLVLGIG